MFKKRNTAGERKVMFIPTQTYVITLTGSSMKAICLVDGSFGFNFRQLHRIEKLTNFDMARTATSNTTPITARSKHKPNASLPGQMIGNGGDVPGPVIIPFLFVVSFVQILFGKV